MARRKRRKFIPQFKADAVRLVTNGKTIAEVRPTPVAGRPTR